MASPSAGNQVAIWLESRPVRYRHLQDGITADHDTSQLYLGTTRNVDLSPDPFLLDDAASISGRAEYEHEMNWNSPLYVAALVISLASGFLLLLLLPPFLLPSSLSGIPPSQCPRPSSISLIICTIIFAGHTAAAALKGRDAFADGTKICAVDAILQTFLITAVFAHLPLIASITLALRRMKHDDDRTLSPALWIVVQSCPYVYGVLPNIPLFTMLGSGRTSFGLWWEFYCIEKDAWWRIVHCVSLVLPPILTLVLSLMIADVLGSVYGDPSPKVRVRPMEWIQLVFLTICSLGTITYLVAEQVIGWSAVWKPRIAEATIPTVVLGAFIVDTNIWRAYSSWIRGRRPLLQDDGLELFDPVTGIARMESPAEWLINKDEKRTRSFHSSHSSFFIPPPAATLRPFSRKISLPRSRTRDAERGARQRSKRSRDRNCRNVSTRSGSLSPPFTYSVARSDTSPTSDEPVDFKRLVSPPSPSYYIPPRPIQRPSPALTRPDPKDDPGTKSPEMREWLGPPSPSYCISGPPSPRNLNGLSRPADLRNQLAANLSNVQTQYAHGSHRLNNPFWPSPKPSENGLARMSDKPRPVASDVATVLSVPSRYSMESFDDRYRPEMGTSSRQAIQSLSGSVLFMGSNARPTIKRL